MNEVPVVKIGLPGEDYWTETYELGQEIDKQFPGCDGSDFVFAMGCLGKDHALEGKDIVKLQLLRQGYNDGPGWIWYIETSRSQEWYADRNTDCWVLYGWCDYTGWGCRDGATLYKVD